MSSKHWEIQTSSEDSTARPTRARLPSSEGERLPYLIISNILGVSENKIVDLQPAGEMVLGRSTTSDVVLVDDSKQISRHHARLRWDRRVATIEDLNSAIGTRVDGVLIQPRVRKELRDGAIVSLGCLNIVFQHPQISKPQKSTSLIIEEIRSLAILNIPTDYIVVNDSASKNVFIQAARLASLSARIHIMGETGVGKDLLVNAIHYWSNRSHIKLVAVNCSQLDDIGINSEIHGHEKWAFTGANSEHPGVFEQAHGGILFLDEVAELPLEAQANLLRIVQNQQVRRIGATAPRPVDVRVISATSANLFNLVTQGKFREDLYYRLCEVCISMPPLRQRTGDIPLLVRYFLSCQSSRTGHNFSIDDSGVSVLTKYTWPGNIRQLMNFIAQLVSDSSGAKHFSDSDVRRVLDDIESRGVSQDKGILSIHDEQRVKIINAMREYRGNKSTVSKMLNIPRSTLYRLLNEYGIE